MSKFSLYPTGAQSEQRLYGKVDRIGLSITILTFNGPTGNRQGRHRLDELVQLANQERIVVVFAEAMLWRCIVRSSPMPCWFVESAPRTS